MKEMRFPACEALMLRATEMVPVGRMHGKRATWEIAFLNCRLKVCRYHRMRVEKELTEKGIDSTFVRLKKEKSFPKCKK